MLYFFMMLFCMESFYSMAWLIAWKNDVNAYILIHVIEDTFLYRKQLKKLGLQFVQG